MSDENAGGHSSSGYRRPPFARVRFDCVVDQIFHKFTKKYNIKQIKIAAKKKYASNTASLNSASYQCT
jgi:hypothetical protein